MLVNEVRMGEWLLTVNVLLDGLVGQDGTTVDVDLVANGNVVAENCYVLETRPLADGAVPANNRRLDPGVVLDTAVLEQHTALQTDTVANDNIRANGDIRTDAAVLANLRRGVDQDVAAVDVWLRGWCEQLGVPARQR